ncbi:hypothetical protein ACFVRU_01395 [Streptomyces sp. NPDC057927]
MKRLAHHWPWVLLLVAALLLLSACGDSSPAPSTSCVEIDVDHHTPKHLKTSKPRTAKPKAPTYRKSSTTKRRR